MTPKNTANTNVIDAVGSICRCSAVRIFCPVFFRGLGAQKTISSYSFDPIVLIFGYIVERTNTKILSSHFCNFRLEPKLRRHK